MVNYQLGRKVQNITILKDNRIPVSRKQLLQQLQNAVQSFPVFSGVHVTRSCFMCIVCRALFVLLSCIFWQLCCLSFFDLRILIIPLVS